MSLTKEEVNQLYIEFLGRNGDHEGIELYVRSGLNKQDIALSLSWSEEANKPYYKWPLCQHFVSLEHNLIYIPIAKNACTTFKNVMFNLSKKQIKNSFSKGPQDAMHIHVFTDLNYTMARLGDYDWRSIEEILEKNMLAFSIIRDPASRLVSAYWDKFVKNRNSKYNFDTTTKKIIDNVYQKKGIQSNYDKSISFSEFINEIIETESVYLDPHWIPQSEYFKPLKPDVLFYIKNIELCYSMLEKKTGIKINRKLLHKLDNKNGISVDSASELHPNELCNYEFISKRSFLNARLMDLIKSCYKEDYNLFNSGLVIGLTDTISI